MSRLRILRPLLVTGCMCTALLAGTAASQAQQYDPNGSTQDVDDSAQAPGRVARLAYLSGQVQFAPAGEDDWGSVEINRPMVIGDRLLTGDDGRATLELGDASVRIDHGSAFDFLNLDEGNVQIELSQGTLNLALRDMRDGENFEVDTPTIAFVATAPGTYRIDNDPSGTGSMVTVFRGSGIVYGENGASREVAGGTSYRFNDSTLASVDVNGLPDPDDFDRFCETRDANYARYADQERQYVPRDMIGGDDLYQYGEWNAVPEYGNVWYPRSVPAGWAPYRYGHWAWIDPWGWTWVDNQPWGFAPFHYGRWVYVRNRWGWCPGPVDVRPVYAPALVAFIGGSGVSLSIRAGGGGPVGWFPLGPRDVYVPWFHASRGYFTNVNVTNIRNVYVNRVVINNFYNDYRNRRYDDIHRRNHYRYRDQPRAVTMVPRTIFANARPVHPAALKLDRKQLQHVRVAVRPDVNPGKASLGLRRPAVRPAVFHGREPFARPVVARHAPPPRPVAFAAREKVIASQHGQPLTTDQMRKLRATRPASEARNERVKLVAGARRAAVDVPRPRTVTSPRPQPSDRGQPAHPVAALHPPQAAADHTRSAPVPPFKNTVHPIPARRSPIREAPLHPGELRSARFRQPERPATLPRPVAIRPAGEPEHAPPASGRLPVVRPIESAPRSVAHRAQPQPRRTDAQPRARSEPLQPQRQAQAQEHTRAQQDQQRTAARQQQAREQQAQERIRAQQDQQRTAARQQQARQQQVQQQRQMQEQARGQVVQRQQQVQQMQMQRAQQEQRQSREQTIQRPQGRYVPRAAPRPPPEHSDERRSKKPPASSSSDTQIR